MDIYYIYFFILGIIVFFTLFDNRKRTRIISLSLICISTWLLIGLRDSTVGADTLSYISDFKRISGWSFSQLLRYLPDLKEPLYYIITWILGTVSHDYTVFLLGWAVFPAIALFLIFKSNLSSTTEYFEAIIVLMMLGLYAFFVAGIRQTAAISVILISYKYLKKANIIKFALCIAIACLIHNSAILFSMAYPLRYLKIKWWYVIFPIVIFAISTTIKIDFVVQSAAFLFDDRFASYGTSYLSSQNNSAFIVQIVLFAICLFKIKPLLKQDQSNNILFVLAIIGLFFQSMAGMLAEMSRISFYFIVFTIILVPRALSFYNRDSRWVVSTVFILGCLYLLLFVSKTNLPLYHLA